MIPITDLDGQIYAKDGGVETVTSTDGSGTGNVSTGDQNVRDSSSIFVVVPYSLDITADGVVKAKVQYKETTESAAGSYTDLISEATIFTSATGATTTSGVLQEGLNIIGKGQTIDVKTTFTLTGGATSDTMDFGIALLAGGYDINPPSS